MTMRRCVKKAPWPGLLAVALAAVIEVSGFEVAEPAVQGPLQDQKILARDFTLPTALFAANSAWNQKAVDAAVLPESDQQILVTYRVLRGDTTTLYPQGELPPTTWPFMDVAYDEWTVPVFGAGTGQ
ncbi:MAG: hypothetical protein ACE5H0_15125, partial [Bacteroidota bacterium]